MVNFVIIQHIDTAADGGDDDDDDDDDDGDGDVFLLVDPLAHITRGLREHLMEKALRALVTPGYKDHIGLSAHNTTNW